MTIGATAVWRIRPSGNEANGGGFDAGIASAGTDYSQQNAAQVSGSVGTAAGTAAFSDATATFTAAMIGNCIQIASGAGFTAGFYYVVGYTSAHAITLDRSPGTGSAAVWKLGGGWAGFTNVAYLGPNVSGNFIYILGAGVPNPSSYSFDYTMSGACQPNGGDATIGYVTIAGDPLTPSSGVPCISISSAFLQFTGFIKVKNIWFVAGSAGSDGIFTVNNTIIENVTYDQNGYDRAFIKGAHNFFGINCEVSSSVAARGSNGEIAVALDSSSGAQVHGFNIHDTLGQGLACGSNITVDETVISKCGGIGVSIDSYNNEVGHFKNNSIDKNIGTGLVFNSQYALANVSVYNNIISNHTQGGTYGVDVSSGTTAVNDLVKLFLDYNTVYNNTTNYHNVSAGTHDVVAGASPFNNEAANDWTPASAIYATALPVLAMPQSITGWNG